MRVGQLSLCSQVLLLLLGVPLRTGSRHSESFPTQCILEGVHQVGESSNGYLATEHPVSQAAGHCSRMFRCTAALFMFISWFDLANSAYSPLRPQSERCTVLTKLGGLLWAV